MRYVFADCVLDTEKHVLLRRNEPVAVEPQVFDLLHLLVQNPGDLISRDRIIDEVWMGRIVSDSAISARIAAARKAVGDDGKSQAVIKTVARRGLICVADVTTDKAPNAAGTMASQRIRYTLTQTGQSLAYAMTGSGPPVVRIGHTTTDLEAEWNTPSERQYFEEVAQQFTLLRLDPVGFGRSDRTLEKFSFDAVVEDLKSAAEAARFTQFGLYSESGGALPAIRFAAKYPDLVRRLVIVGGYAEGRGRRSPDADTDALRSLAAEGWNAPEISFVSAMLLSYFPEGPLESVHDMARNMISASSQRLILQVRDAIHRDSVMSLLPKVRCPTLIIHARHDNVHPLSEAQKLAAGIPDAELLVLETANHIPLPGNAVWPQFIQSLRDFLAK